jgi:hypothetical protein
MLAAILIALLVPVCQRSTSHGVAGSFANFLAGAFFLSAGIQFYLYLAKVSVPLLGTNLILTPEISGLRSIVHFVLFGLCLYFGFIKKPKGSASSRANASSVAFL